MLRLEHVTMKYPTGVTALNDVNIDIKKGEFVFIVGSSGSGKSTLIKLMLKELEPTQGRIVINGRVLADIPRKQIHKMRREIQRWI